MFDLKKQCGEHITFIKLFEYPNGGILYQYEDGQQYWYYQGTQLNCKTQEEFDRLMKLKAFW
jgi:hypothetical protein